MMIPETMAPRPAGSVPPVIRCRVWGDQNRGSRPEQEDSMAASHPDYEKEYGTICVLSDGMGGLTHGKEVSEAVVDAMIRIFYDLPPGTSAERTLLRGCAEAQKKVLQMQENPRDRGATLVAAIVRDGRCSFISVGDSRMLLFRGGGMILLTRDQNRRRRIETQIALGSLPPEARTDRTLRALSMFIGREEIESVDRLSKSFRMVPGDRILLMSDGVYEALNTREMTELVQGPGDQVPQRMIAAVLQKSIPHQDNCSVMMLECSADGNERAGL